MEEASNSKKKVVVVMNSKVTGKCIKRKLMHADGEEIKRVRTEPKIKETEVEMETEEFPRQEKMKMHNQILDLEQKLATLELDLKAKDEYIIAQSLYNNVLLAKENYTNEQLQELQDVVTQNLMEYTSTGYIGIKRTSKIDDEAFLQAVRKTLETRNTDSESKLKELEYELNNLKDLRELEKKEFARREKMNVEAYKKLSRQFEEHKVKLKDEFNRLRHLNKKAKEEVDHQKQKYEEDHLTERNKHELLMQSAEDDKKKMCNHIMDVEQRLAELELELKEKHEELTAESELNNVLLTKERNTNDELLEVRNELIKWLKKYETGNIRIKRMGLIDHEAFWQALRESINEKIPEQKVAELSSYWQQRLSDPAWHPLRTMQVPGTDVHQNVVDADDERVFMLRVHLGERACEIVMTALKELNEYNSSGSYPMPELWNSKENRKATLKEAVSFLHSQSS